MRKRTWLRSSGALVVGAALALVPMAQAQGDARHDTVRGAAEPCSGLHRWGYVYHRRNVSCRTATHVARRAYRRGYNTYKNECGPVHTWHLGGWRVHGPLRRQLVFKFTASGGRRFLTTRPTDCI
jgi:hypothetical protein